MTGWRCPFHGLRVRRVSPRTGRQYVGCPNCHSFKRSDRRLSDMPGWDQSAHLAWLRGVRPADDLPF